MEAEMAWGVGGLVALFVGLLLGYAERVAVAQARRFRATVLSAKPLGGGGGWECSVEVQLDDGTTLTLPMHAVHKKPKGVFFVVLESNDVDAGDPADAPAPAVRARYLASGDDPRRASRAVIFHPLEQYGWAAWYVVGGLAAISAFALGLYGPWEPQAGDCFVADAIDDWTDVWTWVDCVEPHDYEVFYSQEHPADSAEPHPGERLDGWVFEQCDKAFRGYVGRAERAADHLTYAYWTPTRESWEDGDRWVVCAVAAESGGRLTGSARGR